MYFYFVFFEKSVLYYIFLKLWCNDYLFWWYSGYGKAQINLNLTALPPSVSKIKVKYEISCIENTDIYYSDFFDFSLDSPISRWPEMVY